MNLIKIAQISAGEAIRQGVGISGLSDLLKAYAYAHEASKLGLLSGIYDIWHVAELIEPALNFQLRRVPVTFQNGLTRAAPPNEVSDQFNRLVSWLTPEIAADDNLRRNWIKAFLDIHPFTDGNGRIAFILWNWLSGTLDGPEPLPDFYGENDGD